MKTKLTKAIENNLRSYKPKTIGGIKVNIFRGRSLAFECVCESGNVKAGLVDCVRIDEYFGDLVKTHICSAYQWSKTHPEMPIRQCKKSYNTASEIKDGMCNEKQCTWHRVGTEGVNKVLITCYEIKITKADFKSKNGHNFVGNCNYYIIPEELYDKVKDMVPPGIGVIIYEDKERRVGLRKKVECEYRELTDEEQKWMILCVLKKNKVR